MLVNKSSTVRPAWRRGAGSSFSERIADSVFVVGSAQISGDVGEFIYPSNVCTMQNIST